MERRRHIHKPQVVVDFPILNRVKELTIQTLKQENEITYKVLVDKFKLEFRQKIGNGNSPDIIRFIFLDRKNGQFFLFKAIEWANESDYDIQNNKGLKLILCKTMEAPSNPDSAVFIEHKLFY